MTIFQSVDFIIMCSLLGVVLLMINVISGNDKLEMTIALVTVVLGILEGLPILLKPFIAKKE